MRNQRLHFARKISEHLYIYTYSVSRTRTSLEERKRLCVAPSPPRRDGIAYETNPAADSLKGKIAKELNFDCIYGTRLATERERVSETIYIPEYS